MNCNTPRLISDLFCHENLKGIFLLIRNFSNYTVFQKAKSVASI